MKDGIDKLALRFFERQPRCLGNGVLQAEAFAVILHSHHLCSRRIVLRCPMLEVQLSRGDRVVTVLCDGALDFAVQAAYHLCRLEAVKMEDAVVSLLGVGSLK